MSVINKMLNDLDARQKQSDNAAIYTPPSRRGLSLGWLAVISLILLVVLASWYFVTRQHHPQSALVTGKGKQLDAPKGKVNVVPVVHAVKPLSASEPVNSSTAKPSASGGQQSLSSEQAATNEVADKPLFTSPGAASGTQPAPKVADAQHTARALPLSTSSASQPQQPAIVQPQGQLHIKAVKHTVQQQLDALRQRIAQALADESRTKAIGLLNQLLQLHPKDSRGRQQLANLFSLQGNALAARQVLQVGLQLDPDDTAQRLMLARLWVQQKQALQGLQLLQAYHPTMALHQEYYATLATIADQQGASQIALQTYQGLIRVAPANARWWLGMAVSADRLGQQQQAAQGYRQVLQLGQLDTSVLDFARQRLLQLEK